MPEEPRNEPLDHDLFYDGPEEDDATASAAPGGSPADALVNALLEAGPEAADHLLKAAQELLLAAKAVVDAGERMVEGHRTGARTSQSDGDGPPPASADADTESRVRRIDLA
jgi:hypothetical protein